VADDRALAAIEPVVALHRVQSVVFFGVHQGVRF
jgi:hypothetical protein